MTTTAPSGVASRWRDDQAAECKTELDLRAYSSRLLGQDPSLVLHGGGNTSVKLTETNLFGERQAILWVKGSGWDLATIEPAGFAPVRMRQLLALAELTALSDTDMARELRLGTIAPAAPAPSVEAILHAIVPFRYVDHTHADAVITLTNSANGAELIEEVYGDRLLHIPYVMPGFKLAALCAVLYPRLHGRQTIGMLLMNHGIFTWGETARESYERMIESVSLAEAHIRKQVRPRSRTSAPATTSYSSLEVAGLRREISEVAGAPMILQVDDGPNAVAFANRADVSVVSQQGPATPDHVIRTKRLPMLGRDVATYARDYEHYFAEYAGRSVQPLKILDRAPRVVVDPQMGVVAAGRSAADASVAADIYRHTIQIIRDATDLGGYRALPAEDIFDVEYWDLEQAKLTLKGTPAPLAGEIALVTGAAAGIGRACSELLLLQGAAVVALDLSPAVADVASGPAWLGLQCDVTDPDQVRAAIEAGVRRFGGIDIAVLNAGVFPPGQRLEALELEAWRAVMGVNVDASVVLLHHLHPLLRLAPRGGRVVVIGSKNVPAPGPGAAAYSASKAALTQVARVAALEWGSDGIRVNVIHPNAVFDTALWTEEIVEARARQYGLSVAEYRARNVLRLEVRSQDVAQMCAAMCGPAFARTTGAQVPVDGGNERVI
ncbi:MAG: bifunctional aldolase/short-chain dehydrogenase [Candidatus Dormibacteria bacterium]|jgi:rhamnose utilization protein RhaD (predicted bifunctional aldolase and dehydrogenase)/NAD(P)-dependent dehydrogenase (short-subunit alcohol dehydrogenase family)